MPVSPESTKQEYTMSAAYWTGELRSIAGFGSNNDFLARKWSVKFKHGTSYLKWDILDPLLEKDSFIATNLSIDIEDFAKKLLIRFCQHRKVYRSTDLSLAPSATRPLFAGILATFSFCERQRCLLIDEQNLVDFMRFLLFHRFDYRLAHEPFHKVTEPKSFYSVQARFLADHWIRVCAPSEGWPQIAFTRPISLHSRHAAHRRALEESSNFDLTWGDYKKGGTFDNLGLDVGQFYIGYCIELVASHGSLARAMVNCILESTEWSKGLRGGQSVIKLNVSWILSGRDTPKCNLGQSTFNQLRQLVDQSLRDGGIQNGLAGLDFEEMYSGRQFGHNHRSTPAKRFIGLVASAATVCFLALSGWRSSEVEFAFEDIVDEPNLDPLSQKMTPTRYFVEAHVSKSTGSKIHRREITHAQYQYIELIRALRMPKDMDSCLTSSRFRWHPKPIRKQLYVPWQDFVANGQMPVSVRDRLTREAPLLGVLKDVHRIATDVSVGRYCRKPSEEQELVESLVDPELKELLRRGDQSVASKVKYQLSHYIRQEDLLQPNPHSFRHIWVEAVLRRFDGDFGWFVRSHFIHISAAQWFSYMRDKGARAIYDVVSTRVVSGLLYRVLQKKGEGFSGAVVKTVQRLFRNTTIADPDVEESLGRFSKEEVKSINATPWGYCVIRRSSASRARCAENKVPRPQNASDRLCLSCPNFLTTSHNSSELLLIANTHSEIVTNDRTPEAFRRVSASVVDSASGHLANLGIELPEKVRKAIQDLI